MATQQHATHTLSIARGGVLACSWPAAALGAVLGLAAGLYVYRLDQNGYANLYYAAAVRSMLQSWHSFFFVAFDPGGFVSVDKPPLGLWLQVASAKLFGFSGLSILLPQVAAGVASVAVLYSVVRRSFGVPAGLLAALALALTPITVATARNNTSDVPLVLVLVLAAAAVLRATATGRLRWLVGGAALVGIGFNVKMLEAFLPLPAFYVTYLVGAPASWRTRVAHLGLAMLALLAVALPWAAAVDLTPPAQRPYVGSSADNTVRNLALGYNGLTRLLGMGAPGSPGGALPGMPAGSPPSPSSAPGLAPGAAPPGFPPGGPGGGPFAGEIGSAGPLRLFDQQLAGQISWLLPFALFGLVAAGRREGRRWPLNHQQQALVLWSGWLLTGAAFFSVAGMFHRYYLVMLGPPIAALVGIGGVALWAAYRRGSPHAWLLPLALLTTATVQLRILANYSEWSDRLALPLAGLCVAGALTLALGQRSSVPHPRRVAAVAAGAAGLGLLLAPAVWAAYPAIDTGAMRSMLPFAGPQASGPGGPFGGPPGLGAPPPFGEPGAAAGLPPGLPPLPGMGSDSADPRLVDYLQANRGDARFLVATPSAAQAAPLILATDEPVIALGGFGGDRILTPEGVASLVAHGTVRFFLLPTGGFPGGMLGPGGAPGGPPGLAGLPGGPPGLPAFGGGDVTRWVTDHCATVPTDLWQSADSAATGPPGLIGMAPGFPPPSAPAGLPPPPGLGVGTQLYDCAGAA
jgi:4-amino-4-deoxy-L-arabinose transferase-like glycosyltransferase